MKGEHMAEQAQKKPNILVIWGDDIGITNLSCYSDGLMGYRTPNIDRLAKEGMRFTDSYGEQSCTAGRASFITGQSGFRTGLTKVGVPSAPVGLQAEDPTIAELLKPLRLRALLAQRRAASSVRHAHGKRRAAGQTCAQRTLLACPS
jgi:arylsulfatase A-like enzyme